ncbi:hypothetical protein [Streptomyces virginiae]|uniref:hypothetical protein n=1 Tax=Streptomyces virginiae TaxID=1961 RepID=UPI00131BC2F3|nr:hypothetical protein [Streptomyces virginiae]
MQLERTKSGQVALSHRISGPDSGTAAEAVSLILQGTATQARRVAADLLGATVIVHEWRDERGQLALRRASLLTRFATLGGPVLAGTAVDADFSGLPFSLPWKDLAGVSSRVVGQPPAGWKLRPILLHPSPAAAVVTATALALTSRDGRANAQWLANRPVMPALTLTDLPFANGASDDIGTPARPFELIHDGAICPPVQLLQGLPAGRSIWDHYTSRCGPAPLVRLEMSGIQAAVPREALEVVWCVDSPPGCRSDGTLELRCLCRISGIPDLWFFLTLRAKPLSLLRHVSGLVGPASRVNTSSDVITPAFAMASAAELERSGRAVVQPWSPSRSSWSDIYT